MTQADFTRWLLPPWSTGIKPSHPYSLAPPSLNYCWFPEYAMFSCTCHGYTHPLSSCQMSPLILAPTKHLSPGIPALTPLSQTPSSMQQSSVRLSVPHLNHLLVDVESIFMPSLSVAHTVVKCLFGWMDGWMGGWMDPHLDNYQIQDYVILLLTLEYNQLLDYGFRSGWWFCLSAYSLAPDFRDFFGHLHKPWCDTSSYDIWN